MTLSQIYRTLVSSYHTSKKRGVDAEFVLYRLYRPLSFPLSAVLIKLGCTANQVTVLGLLVLLASLGTLMVGGHGWLVAGAILFAVAFILDFADGNIARFRNKSSIYGKFIDGLVDAVACVVFAAAAIGNVRASLNLMPGSLELILGITAAFAGLFTNYYRLRVMYFMKERADAVGGAEAPLPGATGVVALAGRINKNLLTSTPIVLLVLAPFGLLSVFVGLFFCIHVIVGAAEITVSLARLRQVFNAHRAF